MRGSFTISFSDDLLCDLEGVVTALNACGDWSGCGGVFAVDDGSVVVPVGVWRPLPRPSRIVAMRVRRAHRGFEWVDPASLTYAEALATLESRRAMTSLEEISDRVSSAMLAGCMRLDCWRHEEDGARHHGSLEIHATGAVSACHAAADLAPGAQRIESYRPPHGHVARP